MADHSHTPTTVDPEALNGFRHFWSSFTKYSTYTVIGVVAILVLMAIFLV